MSRHYVACKFRPTDSRSYTYHWDGDPLANGDVVKVEDARDGGWKRVTVVDANAEKPTRFDTKPILGKVEAEPEVQRDVFDALDRDVGSDVARDPLNSHLFF